MRNPIYELFIVKKLKDVCLSNDIFLTELSIDLSRYINLLLQKICKPQIFNFEETLLKSIYLNISTHSFKIVVSGKFLILKKLDCQIKELFQNLLHIS